MNAFEAMELSYANIPKLAEKYFKTAVETINSHIVIAAKKGEFSASTRINLEANIQHEVISRLVFHYRYLGYEVKTYDFLSSKMLLVSWQKEPTSCN